MKKELVEKRHAEEDLRKIDRTREIKERVGGEETQNVQDRLPALFLGPRTSLTELSLLLLPHPSVIHHAASFSQSNLHLSASFCLSVLQGGIAHCIMFSPLSPPLDCELLDDRGKAHLVLQLIPSI